MSAPFPGSQRFREARCALPRIPRAGFGVPLVTVLAVVLTLFLFGLSLGFRGQGVTASVQRSVYRDVASSFARSAAAETLHRLRREANQEASPVFDLLRSQDPAALSFTLDQLPQTFVELAVDDRYRLAGGVEVRLLRRAATSLVAEERVPFECLGVLRVKARVTGPRGMVGTWEADYGYRVVLTAAPRPFDIPTFMLLDTQELLSRDAYRGDANVAIQTAVARIATFQQVFRDLALAFSELADKVREMIAKARKAGRKGKKYVRKGEAILAIVVHLQTSYEQASRPPVWPARPWVAREPDSPTLDNFDELHVFHPELVVYSLAEEIDLTRLDLPGRLRDDARFVEADEPELEALGEQFKRTLEAQDPDFPRMKVEGDAYRVRVLEHVRRLDAMLQVYKEFQDLLVELGGEARSEVFRHYRRLALNDQIWKTPYLFEGEGAVEAARVFLSNHPRGMVVVNPPEGSREVLEVSLDDYQGRLVVASSAPVRLDQVRLRDRNRDAVVFLAYQGLEVAGSVEAGLVDLSGRFRASGNSFSGSLVLDRLTTRSALDLMFRGTLRRQPGLLSGPDDGSPDREPPLDRNLHVVLGPEPIHRRVEL